VRGRIFLNYVITLYKSYRDQLAKDFKEKNDTLSYAFWVRVRAAPIARCTMLRAMQYYVYNNPSLKEDELAELLRKVGWLRLKQ
jgi:hypothetical protein